MRARFECSSCGERIERNIMPGKHAVMGCLRKIQREEECCENPDFRDLEGYSEPGKSFRQRIAAAV